MDVLALIEGIAYTGVIAFLICFYAYIFSEIITELKHRNKRRRK